MIKTKILFAICAFLFSLTTMHAAYGQVDDIPQAFKERGFVQHIDYDGKIMYVNIIKDKKILLEEIRIGNTEIINEDKEKLGFTNIKSNGEILIEGGKYMKKDYSIAKKITLLEKKASDIEDGRLDAIIGDVAYVDGNKVKLKVGTLIKGEKKSPYAGQTFASVNALKLGDIAICDGDYTAAGFFVADKFSIAPENEIFKNDVDTLDQADYEKFAPLWTSKSSRKKIFGKEIEGIGQIYDNAEVQEYIQNFAMKLVPGHIQEKIKFIFIVVKNDDINANVRSNGLAYIYTGLLKSLENEAQLATILSHEIAHAIYEHNAKSAEQAKNAQNQKDVTEQTSTLGGKLLNLGKKIKDPKSRDKKDDKSSTENAQTTAAVVGGINYKRLSKYSIKDEYQADRVGLSLMVLAGFDPREASITWKNIYARYGVLTDTSAIRNTLGDLAEEINASDTTGKSGKQAKKSNNRSGTAEAIDLLMKTKVRSDKAKGQKTHPDHVMRFEALNKLISMYWNDEGLLNKAIKAEEEYRNILNELQK